MCQARRLRNNRWGALMGYRRYLAFVLAVAVDCDNIIVVTIVDGISGISAVAFPQLLVSVTVGRSVSSRYQ